VNPIDAYVGEGKVAATKTDSWTPIQHMKVAQLYIPGLVSNTNAKNLYEVVWQQPEFFYANTLNPM
jgi:hypothetical protein